MLTGAAPEVGHRFRTHFGRTALAGIALAVTVAACRRLQPAAPAQPAAPSPAEKTAAPADSAAAAGPPPARGKQIVVAYSSNMLGEYEPCG